MADGSAEFTWIHRHGVVVVSGLRIEGAIRGASYDLTVEVRLDPQVVTGATDEPLRLATSPPIVRQGGELSNGAEADDVRLARCDGDEWCAPLAVPSCDADTRRDGPTASLMPAADGACVCAIGYGGSSWTSRNFQGDPGAS